MVFSRSPRIVVEDDSFLRLIKVVLDPSAPHDLLQAFEHFCAHDVPDFAGWCARIRDRVKSLHPSEVRLVRNQDELVESLPGARALVVEALAVTTRELAAAGRTLKVVQRYGTITRNIDIGACRETGVQVRTLRRRANISTAEQALMLLLALARQLLHNANRISFEQLQASGYSPTHYNRSLTPNGNWARIAGMKTLYGRRLGIVGLGEIGRELALRAQPFGMPVLYTQRHRLTAAEEKRYGADYRPFDELLETSDCVSLHLPRGRETRGIIGRRELALMKPGALLINVAQPSLIERAALLEALKTGGLGGFAMDGFYEEPATGTDPLLGFRNVIVTPHLAGSPRFNSLDDIEELLDNLAESLGT